MFREDYRVANFIWAAVVLVAGAVGIFGGSP